MALGALALGCGDDGNAPAEQQDVALSFAAVVGEEPFVCGDTYENLGANGTPLVLSDFRFYVQDVALKNAAGAWVPVELEENSFQSSGVALLDFEDGCGELGTPELNGIVRGTVPPGDYDGLQFKMGVPFEINHVNSATAPSPLNLTSLFWNWQGGYKFLRIDSGQFSETDWRMHLGSTGCEGDPMAGGVTSCANGNRTEVELDTFDVSANTVVADFAALVEGSAVDQDAAADAGCMSKPVDTDCGPLFANLGLSFGENPGGEQQFFSAE
ncbi:MAG: metallo-mystery pair system four-Cys motif protein [Deltaproteobacteria bacterium]|nr:metallo-mystery pair system four-Cys motif protein [Deltaproteobacteria bacterium]NND29474.1 metallo-mystery pair system four-Cys motif protein [Myxococcales bacterium]MBT8466737.1 metallo-mystery pair system four-Cys motif protein [Deltaproteobacteria bacterium]MBT8483748.1 metallo-mystery pair system four-Cys motif protein [Deltaproteobacteria bacterium]NNK08802.1 metallo-mystery pair system four-Cys motif protein [Myxococcales bacterium]